MIVRFDSLDRFEVPKFHVCNPGCVYEDGVLSNSLGILADTTDEELILNFNTTSELSFRLNKVRRSSEEENAYTNKLYRSIQNRRLIFVEDIGFFVIRDVTDGYEEGCSYKDVRAESCEYEISQKALPYIEDGTYQFQELLEKVVSSLPLWKIGDVNLDVAKKWRTFEDVSVEKNALSFLLEDMQDAYECIFLMDTTNRLIHVYDQNYFVEQTDIHITKDDLIDSIEIKEASDDLYTAINVQGDDSLNISPVNPLGGNVIYNFDYYMGWMSPALSKRVNEWKNLVSSKADEYYNLNLQYYNILTSQSDNTSEIDMLNTQLEMYRRMRDNIVAEGTTVTVESYNKIIVENGGVPVGVQNELRDTLASIDELIDSVLERLEDAQGSSSGFTGSLSALEAQIKNIHEETSILGFFSDNEYAELSNYIFEGNYTDEYISVTESMTYSERFQQMKTLYDRAVSRLSRISEPTQEFSIDVENFLFVKEFLKWSEQLRTGCLINVEIDTDDIAALFLSSITVNYDDKSLSMTFGNRFNRFDPKAMFNNILGDIKKSANSINYIKEILYPVKNGEFNAMQEAIESSGILTKNAALASTNQEILIDDTGILGRMLLDNGDYDNRQIKITNQSIVFTEDGWDTASTCLGNFTYNNPFTGVAETHYGVVADMLIGSHMITTDFGLYNEDNSVTMNGDGLTITSDCTGYFPKANVFTIQKKIDVDGVETYEKQLYIDSDGNVVINGTISIFTTNGSDYGDDSLGAFINSTNNDIDSINKDLSDINGEIGTLNTDVGILQEQVDALDEYFLFIRYSPYEDGRDFTESPQADTMYMGTSYQATNEAPTDPSAYEWVKIRGDEGIPGVSQYLHIKYANDIINKIFTDNNGEDIGKYIGILVDTTEKDSDVFDDYTWKLWTEDVAEELVELQQQLQGNIDNVNEELQGKIGKTSTELKDLISSEIAGVNGTIEEIKSVASQIKDQYNQIQANIEAQINDYKADLGQYLAYNENGLTLGAKTSDFKTVIDNNGMYFKQDDTIVSYVNNSQLYIPNAVIENTLILGNFFFAPGEEGGFSLVWQEKN